MRKLLPGLIQGSDATDEERDQVLQLGFNGTVVTADGDELSLPKTYERPPPDAGQVPEPEEFPFEDPAGGNKQNSAVGIGGKKLNPEDLKKRDRLMAQLSESKSGRN